MLEERPCKTEIAVGYGVVYVHWICLCKSLYAMFLNERYYYSSMRLMQCGDIVDAGANLERRGKGRHQTRLDYLGPIKLR